MTVFSGVDIVAERSIRSTSNRLNCLACGTVSAAAEEGALERGIGCIPLRLRRIHVLLVRHVVEAGVVVVVVEAGDGGDGAQQLLWLLVQIFVLRHRWTSWSSNFRRSETSNGRLTSEYSI